MNASNIQTLLSRLGSTRIHQSGQHVYSSCPLAPYTHAKRVDAHPSFTVMVDDSGISGAKCHACNFSGSLLELMYKFQSASHRKVSDLIVFVEQNNGPTFGSLIEKIKAKHAGQEAALAQREAWRAAKASSPDLPPPAPVESVSDPNKEIAGIRGVQLSLQMKVGERDLQVLPEDALSKWREPAGEVLEYLLHARHTTPQMLKLWEVGWDAKYGRIMIPVRDVQKRLVGYSGRAFSDSVKPKYMHAKGFRRDFYLYGEHLWEYGKGGTLCVVEGFFDVWRLVDYGYRAGAVMGSHLSEFQIEKIVRYFDNVLIVPDGDKPGYEASQKMFEQLSVRLPAHIVPTPQGMDPDDFSRDDARLFLGEP
jgi:DNA primase